MLLIIKVGFPILLGFDVEHIHVPVLRCAHPTMLLMSEHLEVAKSEVQFVAVAMVNVLVTFQLATKRKGHHDSVDIPVTVLARTESRIALFV